MKILVALALLAGCVPLPHAVPGHPSGPTGKPQRPYIIRPYYEEVMPSEPVSYGRAAMPGVVSEGSLRPPRLWIPGGFNFYVPAAGQEYGEPIPSPPPEPNEECHIQCGRQHCEDWLKCGRAYEGSKLLRDRCRDRVRDRHEKCHKKCDPGIG